MVTTALWTLVPLCMGLLGAALLALGLIRVWRDHRAEPDPVKQDDFLPAMRRWQGMLNKWGVWQ